MIVWVASYPRSGNTFMRILMHRLFGLNTSTIYDVDGVAARLGADFVGYRQHTEPLAELRAGQALQFVKTHRPLDEAVDESDKAICLVRDGRDAVVSWARQRAEQPGHRFESELQELVVHPERTGAGCWGSNVLSWLNSGIEAQHVVHYHELVRRPTQVMTETLSALGLDRPRVPGAVVPSFEELQAVDRRFFRVGTVGTHRDEMSSELQDRFLEIPDNRQALRMLGYID